MDESKLVTAIQHAEEQAESPTLQDERNKALAYYNGNPFGNEVEGRSQVVSRDVHDTIEWIKPSLLKMFASGDEVVKFNAAGHEDVEASEQESEYINHVFMQKNDGFMILHDWFHDALLLKNAYVRAYWDESETVDTERYSGLSEEQLAYMLQDHSIEVSGADVDETGLYTVELKRSTKYGCVKVENLIPEQVKVSHSARGIDVTNADFFQYWELKTLSDLRLEGFDVADDINDGESSSYEEWQRNIDADALNYGENSASNDPSMRMVKVRENWIRFDANNDGKAELLHVILVGDEVLLKEEADIIPVACICPAPSPHRHNGKSVADGVMDLQLIKSQLLRGYFDNLYLSNNGRYAISDRVNLSDMLQSRPGGVVRVNGEPAGAIMPLVHPQIGQAVLQGIEYIDTVRENRTGVTRYNQGIDANSLNKTASGITQIMSASQQRIELIARLFASGVKQLFWIIHKLTKQNATQPDVIRLRNDYVQVDPRTWRTRNDLTISVGLGTGNKDQMLVHLQTILTAQKEALMIGVATPQNVYEALKALTVNAGFKDAEKFWTDPSKQQPQQPQPSPEEQKIQAQIQIDQQKLQMEQQKYEAHFGLEKEKTEKQMELEAWKAQQQAELEKYKARIKAESEIQLQAAKMEMQTGLEETKLAMQSHNDNMSNLLARQTATADIQNASAESVAKMMEMMSQIAEKVSKPRKVVRDKDGRVAGVE